MKSPAPSNVRRVFVDEVQGIQRIGRIRDQSVGVHQHNVVSHLPPCIGRDSGELAFLQKKSEAVERLFEVAAAALLIALWFEPYLVSASRYDKALGFLMEEPRV